MNVKELRAKYGLSQQELADRTGIPKGRINGWEQKGVQPKVRDNDILKAFFESLEKKDSLTGRNMDFREKIDKILTIKKIKLWKLAEESGLGTTLEKAYKENRPMRDTKTHEFLQNLGISGDWWDDPTASTPFSSKAASERKEPEDRKLVDKLYKLIDVYEKTIDGLSDREKALIEREKLLLSRIEALEQQLNAPSAARR